VDVPAARLIGSVADAAGIHMNAILALREAMHRFVPAAVCFPRAGPAHLHRSHTNPMSRTRNFLLAASSLALLSGCVSARATMLVPGGQQPPVPEDQVTVYLQETEVPSTCQRYALIHTAGDVDMTGETEMINAAKRRAGKIGANAIVLGSVREPSSGRRVAAAVFGVSKDRKSQMVAYRCGDAAAAPSTASGS